MKYTDYGNQPLETQLSKILYNLFVIFNKLDILGEISDREFYRRLEEEKGQHHLEEMRKAELERVSQLQDMVSDWERAQKINFINLLSSMLTKTGMILFGDISFKSRSELEECKGKYNKYWDNDEIYFIAEEILEVLKNKYLCEYIKLSHCAGVLTIRNK